MTRPLTLALCAAGALGALTVVPFGSTTRAVPSQAANLARDYPVQPVPFTAVQLTDAFWAPKIKTNAETTIPFAFGQCETSGRVDNFIRAAQVLRGTPPSNLRPPGYPFDDTDLYKVIEGAAYTLAVHRDPKLDPALREEVLRTARDQGYDLTDLIDTPQTGRPTA